MIFPRKTQIILALFISSIFLFQSCATIIRGTSQKIPVTSNPQEAKITVDGEDIGYTPLNLKLKKKKSHVILIEKQDYNPLEIKIAQVSLPSGHFKAKYWTNLANTCLGLASGLYLGLRLERLTGSVDWEEGNAAETIGALSVKIFVITAATGLGLFVPRFIDSKSGANYTLSPKNLNVTLTKIEGSPQPNFILINAEQFKNIKWIRIKCTDSDGEDEIVKLD